VLWAIVIALAALVLSVVLFTWHSKVEAERAQAIRDASYREALSRFQRDLRLGIIGQKFTGDFD
jgi:hypothetical protein